MKHTYAVKVRVMFLALLGIACFAAAPVMAAEPEWWTQQKRTCGLPSNLAYNDWDGNCNNSSGADSGSGYGPNLWEILRSFRSQQARAANEQGVQAYNQGDWATAITYFNQALQKFPNEPIYLKNLSNSQANLANQQAKEKAEREERQNKVAADNMQQSIHNFAQTLNAAPVSGGLDFDGRTFGNAPAGNSGGLDFTATVTPPGKSAAMLSFGDPMVVDARVPTGLDQATENAIAKAYSNAPPGVSERVRKGFQAVMERDWKVARAWFEDALNRDPGNPGLQRLVVLADDSQQHGVATLPDGRTLQLPTDADILLLFPGEPPGSPAPAPKLDGTALQLPTDADVLLMFPGETPGSPAPARHSTPTFIIGKEGQLIQVPENSNQESPTYIKGKDGKLIEVPQPKDFLMFPEYSPSETSSPMVETGSKY